MKYTQEIEIDLPRERVAALFMDTANLPKWQPGFVSMTPVSGEPGTEGAVSALVYKMGKREIEMTETILRWNPPEQFDGIYEAKGIKNWQYNRIEPVGDSKTKWISTSEFQFKGFMKLMALLMPGAFKKQSRKYLEQFKAFAEAEPA